MRRHLVLRVAALVLTLLLATVLLVPLRGRDASAASNGLWSVFPTTVPGQLTRPYFQPLLTPGVPVSDSMTITNNTTSPLNLDLYAADAFNTPEGGFASRVPTAPKLGISAWISLPITNVTVAGHGSAEVPFTISPPVGATPGDHAGSIVAVDTVPTITHSGAINVRSIQAVGTRVYGRVVGPLKPSLAVTELQVSTQGGLGKLLGGRVNAKVSYRVVNTGNIRLTPTVNLSVSPLIGGSTDVKLLALPELLPQGSVIVRQAISGILPGGRLTAHVDVTSSAAKTSADASTWVIPWLLLLIIVLIVAGLWYWRRRRNAQLDAGASWAGMDAVRTP